MAMANKKNFASTHLLRVQMPSEGNLARIYVGAPGAAEDSSAAPSLDVIALQSHLKRMVEGTSTNTVTAEPAARADPALIVAVPAATTAVPTKNHNSPWARRAIKAVL